MNISRISPIVLAVVVKQFKYTIMEDSLLEMNHKNTTLAIAAIVVAVTLTTAVFTVPQQALAYKHHHHHHNHSSNVDVTQNTSQANFCSSALCVNNGNNTATIEH
jgi:NhaP-type Na+/H+ or K+/H+ antiporter